MIMVPMEGGFRALPRRLWLCLPESLDLSDCTLILKIGSEEMLPNCSQSVGYSSFLF